MVKPILLYGCQVWGNDYINYESKDIHHLDRIPFEEVQNKYCKLLLCVGRFTSNMAARAELGRHPLMLSVAALQIKFWNQILKSPGKLIYNAYQEDIRNDSRGVKNWITGVKIVLERCGLTHFWQNQTIPSNFNISKCVYNILKHKYENLFFNSINSDTGVTKTGGNKLRTYAKLKHEYKMENYLNLNLELHSKKAMAEIRVSAHNLEIERGRKNKPANERFCRNCKTMVEDEVHFISDCPIYESLRNEYLPRRHQNPDAYFINLFKTSDTVKLENLAIFIRRAMTLRKEKLYQNK